MSDYDIRQHLDDARDLIAAVDWNEWGAARHNMAPLELIALSVVNLSSRNFLVVPFEPRFGSVSWPLMRDLVRSANGTADALQTEVFAKTHEPPSRTIFADGADRNDFIHHYGNFIIPSYTRIVIDAGGLAGFGFKQELAVLLMEPTFQDPKIVLMIKKYAGGAFCAGISLSTGNWLSDEGFLPQQDQDGSGICDHISNISTDICKLSSGDPIGPQISASLGGIRVHVYADSWSRFSLQDD